MSGRILLDTNIVIALFAKEVVVQQRLAETDEAFVSSIVLGELYYGAQKSSRGEANIVRVNTFAAASAVLVCDTATAQYYGAIKNQLRAKGHPIPENDIWIAAMARQHQLTLVTRDEHFQAVEGLRVEQQEFRQLKLFIDGTCKVVVTFGTTWLNDKGAMQRWQEDWLEPLLTGNRPSEKDKSADSRPAISHSVEIEGRNYAHASP